MPPRGGFTPPLGVWVYPLIGVVLSPQRTCFILPRGWFYPPIGAFFGGGYHPFGVGLSPLSGDFILPLGGRGGGVTL